MVFSSIVFIFYFLPIFLFCYYALPFKHATLLLFSLVFYAYGEVIYTYVMLLSILVNYGFGLWIAGQEGRGRKLALGTGVVANLGILIYFKYLGFFYEMAVALAPNLLSGPPQVHLPLGISFFTFHALSYLIDVYRRQVPVERSLIYVAVYITMFPQLVAGPIIRFHDIRDEIHNRRVNAGLFAEGIQIFVIGLAQKVLIANTVAVAADQIFAIDPTGLSLPVAWLGIACYTLQIFFDFCGYSTMAIGLGLMIGFHFPLNFNYPYIAQSITEFWRRWHISLSMWFRDYLYIPLGGNRAGPLATYRNLLIVFLLCGLWHGANWTFVVWGLWHGAFLVFERLGISRLLDRSVPMARHLYTLLVVMVGWVFFRADTLGHAWTFLKAMAGAGQPSPLAPHVLQFLTPEVATALAIGMVAATPVLGRLVRGGLGTVRSAARGRILVGTGEALYLAGLLGMFALAVMSLAAGTYNPFIYFRF
ncbi:MBOAT family protein [Azospirillum lipoferum]|uniref:Probable alginate O-acetylase AlgI n=1 Tax=Azospirillum lipoferum TaxID=193 RepID=A0A5A9GDT3_AZOLI|nr:MBOAT family protein [Azospirillum lipoferum]